ncbi:MAG: maleylpyruvate isomerase family mycothiol-dependent enzyme [Gammaproteobacteria bacterium]|nr:maleylpyruvate isomerase family mycothiol-dependent enzyme [Gammaproteobacteria bacterium]HJL79776.1 maleylpyruvate isomerase family mycothiol-dependent enzyme [Gammaproteobacteria bacterium]HJM09594.1 maleylpyruvate isomerase family mycothiol-dependent enzyme [Gammaproteobacteria bacterium]HJN00088.1 maleylpyruvate isomerase family mycothiol-dependent enzyme [Gammaproteobacteria bacterium]
MEKIISSIENETRAIESLIDGLDDLTWKSKTSFKSWSPEIIISHLLYFDRMTIHSLNDPVKFNEEASFLFQTFSKVTDSLSRAESVRDRLSINDQSKMIDAWKTSNHEMANLFLTVGPDRRCQWFGPDMSARMFMTARYMESWAHAQAIYDLIDQSRIYSDDIEHIVQIGIKTFKWSFRNRKLDVPEVFPFIELEAPSGKKWSFNDRNQNESVTGKASDFCHVVTQNRNIQDTDLEVNGKISEHWMSIAQCFAGEPEDPPKQGTRN